MCATLAAMDTRQAQLLAAADPAEVGRRLRAARVAKGLTQSGMAGTGLSAAYISRLESGHRRPTAKVLDRLAQALDVPVEELLGAMPASDADEIRLLLNYAELSMESGEPAEAEARTAEALERLRATPTDALVERARFLRGRALEGLGRLDEAIGEFEQLVTGATTGLMQINAGIALSRSLRESGDLTRAIEAGEGVLDRVEDLALESCDEAVQLATTVAAAYYERGDTGHAMRMCSAAITRAEAAGSAAARAAAYWNASMIQGLRGQVKDAVPLAERALALLSEGRDARNVARLRGEVGRLKLALDPPALEEAREDLEQAASELRWSSATPLDRAWIDLSLARAHYLSADVPEARALITQVLAAVEGNAPLLAAEATSLQGLTFLSEGDVDRAAQSFRDAVQLLSAIGADRGAAQLWFDLAEQFEAIGMADEARDAYKRAAASSGLRSTAGARPRVRF